MKESFDESVVSPSIISHSCLQKNEFCCETSGVHSGVAVKSEVAVLCAAVFGSVLQCVVVCCSALQCAAVCCSVLQCVAVCCSVVVQSRLKVKCMSRVKAHAAVCCSVLQRVQCVAWFAVSAVCSSVL